MKTPKKSSITQSMLASAMAQVDVTTSELAVLCQNHDKALKEAQQKVTMTKGRLSALISILDSEGVLP